MREISVYPLFVHVKGIGDFTGSLVRIGLDFVEFKQELLKDIARWIIPLNRFAEARCETEAEE